MNPDDTGIDFGPTPGIDPSDGSNYGSPDLADAGPWTPPAYQPPMFPNGYAHTPEQQNVISRMLSNAGEFAKNFITDLNFFDPDISTRERLFRMANVGSFFLPIPGLGEAAPLLAKMAVKGLETGGVSAALSAIRGEPITPSFGIGGFLGGAAEGILGLRNYFGAAANPAAHEFAARMAEGTFANPGTTPINTSKWAMVTAGLTDSSNIALNAEKNAMRTQQLAQDLRRLGYGDAYLTKGFGPNQGEYEDGFLAPGMPRSMALALGKKYGQGSVLTNEGLFDLNNATLSPLVKSDTRFNEFVNPEQDYHTVMPDGTRWTTGFGDPIAIGRRVTEGAELPTDALDLVGSMIKRDGPSMIDKALDIPIGSTINSWYTKLVRFVHPFEQMEKMLGKAPEDRTVSESMSKLAALDPSSWVEEAIQHAIPSWANRTTFVNEGLIPILKELNPGEFQDFENYGLARQYNYRISQGKTPPLLSNGERLTPDTINSAIEDAETANPHFPGLFDRVQTWRNKMLEQLMLVPGFIDQNEFQQILEKSKDYVPLRFADNFEDDVQARANALILSDPINRLRGLTGQIAPWTQSLVKDARSWARMAGTKDVVDAFVTMLDQNDPSAYRDIATITKGSVPELTEMQQSLAKEIEPLDPTLAKSVAEGGPEILGLLAPDRMLKAGWLSTMRTAEDGSLERVNIKINNPDVMDAFQALRPADTNLLTKIFAGVAGTLHTGATLATSFIERNPLKHMQYAMATAGATPLDIVKGFMHAFNKDDVYHLYMASGGGRAGLADTLNNFQDNLEQMINAPSGLGRLTNVIMHPIDSLAALSSFMDSGTRIGVFNKSYEDLVANGVLPQEAVRQAALDGRNAGVDFRMHGTQTNAIRQITAFWNAAIQSQDNMVRAFKNDPMGATLRSIAGITVPSTLLYFVNRNDPDYLQLPDWEREMFWHVKAPAGVPVVGDKWLRFPKPFDLGILFGSVPERILSFLDGQDRGAVDKLAADYGSKLMGDALPIPTLARPLLENAMNYSFLRHRPIEPKSFEDLAPQYRATGSTSQLAQAMGGWLGISPMKLDNVLGGWTGGLGRTAEDAATSAVDVLGAVRDGTFTQRYANGTFDPRDVPGLQAFVSQFPRTTESVDKLYEFADQLRQAEYTRSELQRSMRLDDLQDWMNKKALMLGSAPIVNPMMKALSGLRQQRDMILRDTTMSASDRATLLDSIARAQLTYSMAFQPIEQYVQNQKPY